MPFTSFKAAHSILLSACLLCAGCGDAVVLSQAGTSTATTSTGSSGTGTTTGTGTGSGTGTTGTGTSGTGTTGTGTSGTGTATGTGTAGSGGSIAASAPATLVAVSPAIVQAGSSLARVTLQATGMAAGAIVLVDGAPHTAALLSSTAAEVVLTQAELATGSRHTVTIQNSGQPASNAKSILVTGGYWAFGDSITYGYGLLNPAAQNYAFLLAAAHGLTLINSGVTGAQACDVWKQLYATRAGYAAVAAPLYSLMIGTNDVDVKGKGAYEAVFSTCDLAALTWLGTPRASKLLAGDADFLATGSCTNSADANALGSASCPSLTGTVTATLTTTGNPLYVWYLLNDAAQATDGITITLDGTPAGAYRTQPSPLVATYLGGTVGVGVVRLAAQAGTHTVRIGTAGMAGVLGIGSNPVTGADHPRLLVGDLPNQAYGTPVATVQDQETYIADTLTIEQQLLADGMDLRRALTRDTMQGTVYEMADQLHPNILGQQELQTAFEAVLP